MSFDRRSLMANLAMLSAGSALVPHPAKAVGLDAAGDPLAEAMAKLATTLSGFPDAYPGLRAPASELDRAEGYRLFLRYLTIGIDTFVQYSDPLFPAFFQATRDGVRKFAGDSPEQLYDKAAISGGHDYLVTGSLRDVALIEFGIYSGGLYAGADRRRLIDSLTERDLRVQSNGEFKVRLSRSERGPNVLRLTPDASSIVVRRYLRDPISNHPPPLAIHRMSGDAQLQPLDTADLAKSIERAGNFALWNVQTWAKWMANNRDRQRNSLAPMPDEGDIYTPAGHRYLSGYWQLPPGKALLVSFVPSSDSYWSFVPMNFWMESFEWRFGNRVFASKYTTQPDRDGVVRLALGPVDPKVPGVPWIETMGHSEGGMVLRIARHEGPMPSADCQLIGVTA
ncbi:hypothetical protein [Novosphingobium sp.]|uniref:hypothetical protein n=1 Tax=Novosphingobium sp. TaxID=1874826 RepID=UPI0035B192E0